MKLARSTAYLLACMVAIVPRSDACTIFMAQDGDLVLVGNNEDYYLDTHAKMYVTKATKKERGRICFGWDQRKATPFAQGGVNDAGLFFDVAVVPKGAMPPKGKPNAPANMGDAMLAQCATVDDAVAWLGQYRLPLLVGSHMLIVDAKGAAAVIELVDGEMKVIRREGKGIGVTNFSVTRPELGNAPCPRFEKMRTEVKEGPVTVEHFKSVLQAVGVPKTFDEQAKKDGGTLYSNVYDLGGGKIYFYNRHSYDKVVTIDIAKELKSGDKTYDVDEMFAS